MGITSGDRILASDWNSYIRSKSRKRILKKDIFDHVFVDESDSGSGTFWVRSSGWNWPDFFDPDKDYGTFSSGTEMAIWIDSNIVAFRANKNTVDIPSVSSDDWDIYRYEFPYSTPHPIVTGDEVVYGGGLFTAKTNAGTTPPLLPKYGVLALSFNDPNYDLSCSNNTKTYYSSASNSHGSSLVISLTRPGVGSDIKVFELVEGYEESSTFWLSPGLYSYSWEFEDDYSTLLNTFSAHIESQVYDDNVQQGEELRAMNTSLSSIQGKGTFRLDASAVKSSPRLTGESLDKKGGTSSLYTGDW